MESVILLPELREIAGAIPERAIRPASVPPGFIRFKLRGSDCGKTMCPNCKQKGLGIWPWITSYQDRVCRQVERAMTRLWHLEPSRHAMSAVTVEVDGQEIRDHPSRYSIRYFDCCKAQLFERNVFLDGKSIKETWYSPEPHPGLVSRDEQREARKRKADAMMAALPATEIRKILRRGNRSRGFLDRFDAMREIQRRGCAVLKELDWPCPENEPDAVYMNRYTADKILAKNIVIENPYDCTDDENEDFEKLDSILEHWLPESIWTDDECLPEYNPKKNLLGWAKAATTKRGDP